MRWTKAFTLFLICILIYPLYGATWYRQSVSTESYTTIDVASTTMRMSLSDLRTEIRFLIKDKDTTNKRWSDTELNRLINTAQTQIALLTECQKCRFKIDIDTISKPAEYPLPHEVINIERVTFLEAGESERDILTGRTLIKMDKEYTNWEDSSRSTPTDFYQIRDKIGFYPMPVSTGTVYLDASVIPDKLENDNDYPFNDEPYLRPFHYLIVYWVTSTIFLSEEKATLYALYKKEFDTGIETLKRIVRNKPFYESSIRSRTR